MRSTKWILVIFIIMFLVSRKALAQANSIEWWLDPQHLEDRFSWRGDYDFRELPLDTQHVRRVDRIFYRQNKELGGRDLTWSRSDYPYRRKWTNIYLATVCGVPNDYLPSSNFPIPVPGTGVGGLIVGAVEAIRTWWSNKVEGKKVRSDLAIRDNKAIDYHIDQLKWKKFNESLNGYESAKNAAGDRVEGLFKSKYEEMAYDNLLDKYSADIERDKQKDTEQQAEKARLEGQIRDFDEQIYQTINAIENLKSNKQSLESRLDRINKSITDSHSLNEKLSTQIDQMNESIAAEEARLQALQTQQASASSGLETFMGAMNLAGNMTSMSQAMSSSTSSGRSKAYGDAESYAPTSTSDSGMPDWDAYAKQHNAKTTDYMNSRMKERYGGTSSLDKIPIYRQRNQTEAEKNIQKGRRGRQ